MQYSKKFVDCFWHGFFDDHPACVPTCEKESDLCSAVEAAKHCESCVSFIPTDKVFEHLKQCFEYGQG